MKKIIYINSIMYTVNKNKNNEEYRKTYAYILNYFGFDYVLPYHGDMCKYVKKYNKILPGIYSRKKSDRPQIILPKISEREAYSLSKVSNIGSDDLIIKKSSSNIKLSDGEGFTPPLYIDDDDLNRLVKLGIIYTHSPLSAYDEQYQNVDMGTSIESRKTNVKKALLNNRTMSSTKAKQMAEIFGFNIAIVLESVEDSVYPIGKQLVVYLNNEFKIDSPENINILVDPNDEIS